VDQPRNVAFKSERNLRTAGLLISSGVGAGAGTALGATLVGAGAGAATSAVAYTVTAGDSYSSGEMTANALIGTVTGAASALTGPAVVLPNVAKSGAAMALRAGMNALGAEAAQIVHNKYYDEGAYPSGGELTGASAIGALTSGGGDLADQLVTQTVAALSGNQIAGQLAGSLTYNIFKGFGSNYYVNQGLNYLDCVAEGGTCAK
jgi:hypothetical protein